MAAGMTDGHFKHHTTRRGNAAPAIMPDRKASYGANVNICIKSAGFL
jgi:hypothetical protein